MNKEQKQQYQDYDEEFGVDGDTKTLFTIALNHDLIKPDERVEPILTMFEVENETLPHFNVQNTGSVLDIDKINSEPKILRRMIDKNYDQYLINGYDFEL